MCKVWLQYCDRCLCSSVRCFLIQSVSVVLWSSDRVNGWNYYSQEILQQNQNYCFLPVYWTVNVRYYIDLLHPWGKYLIGLFQTSVSLCKMIYCLQIFKCLNQTWEHPACPPHPLCLEEYVILLWCFWVWSVHMSKVLKHPLRSDLDSTGLLEYKDLHSEVRIV